MKPHSTLSHFITLIFQLNGYLDIPEAPNGKAMEFYHDNDRVMNHPTMKRQTLKISQLI
jgi:hypothetical protein